MEKKNLYLQMIQGIVNRMASNSFMLKGWAVTLIAGIFALASKDSDKVYFLIAYVPIIIFWGLDAYYLMQERLFRNIYNRVRCLNDSEIDFSMDTSEYIDKNTHYSTCLLSATELWFYLPLALLSAAIIILTYI